MTQRVNLEFILHTHEPSNQLIKSSLSEFGDDLSIADIMDNETKGRNIKCLLIPKTPQLSSISARNSVG
ncbi:MAG: hypothetical protein NC916_01180 [Candidatus Omnitrophica bacterium]|nr:hypothetical protein [Candidatus Omnitrophota bacterium]